MDVDQVVVLSLNRRMDRRLRFLDGLPRPWPLPFPRIVDATDGFARALPIEWARAGAGAYGCLLSHVRVLDAAITTGVHSLLVLEDDALFVDNFTVRLDRFDRRIPDDWGLLMLGGQHISPPTYLGVGVVRCTNTQRTHGYVVRGSAMKTLHAAWSATIGHLDHELPAVQHLVPTYAPHPFLIGQAAGRSDLSHQMESARFW